MKLRRSGPLLIAAALLFAGCQKADEGTPTAGDAKPSSSASTSTPSSTATASFADASAVLTKNCAGCHSDRPKAGLDVRTYESIVASGLVKAGDAKGSVLVQALHGTDGKKQMPPRGPLPADDIKKIEDWIQSGAKS